MSQHKVYKSANNGYIKVLDGIERKTLVFGDNTLLTEFRLEKGKILPMHKHEHEQTGYLVLGGIVLIIAGERYELHPGDSWSIPGNIEHGAEILKNSVAVEVFSPVREDYLPQKIW